MSRRQDRELLKHMSEDDGFDDNEGSEDGDYDEDQENDAMYSASEDYDEDDSDDHGQRMNMSRGRASVRAQVQKSNITERTLAKMARSISDVGMGLGALAKSQLETHQLLNQALNKHDMSDEGGGDEGGYSGEDQTPRHRDDDDDGEPRLNLSRNGGMSRLAGPRAKLSKADMQAAYAALGAALSKDDEASNFGEEDNDTPGNAPYDPKHVRPDGTVITGKPGSGPGPMAGSTLRKAIVEDLASEFERRGVLPALGSQISRAATTPAPGTDLQIDAQPQYQGLSARLQKSVDNIASGDMGKMVEECVKLDWQDLNRMRVELIPGSMQTFPVFGAGWGGSGGVPGGGMQQIT